jgi:hypothetical protein
MFYPIEGGSVYEIPDNAFGFVYKCNVPPVGYGMNSITGEIQKTDIIKRSEVETEQYWERYQLPKEWTIFRKEEKEKQKFDKFYYNPYLENIRGREWNRRLCGVWFWNYNPIEKKSAPVYITGTHYLYATYWKFQGKHMDFRINDQECWYVVKYIETDPNALGLNEITKRKLGKTARLGCWIYERTSRSANHHAGLQSKTDPDAWEVFKKAIVHPWKGLPDFFRPIFDTNKGDDPNDELRFFNPSRRGSNIEDDDVDEALNSWIDFKSSDSSAYDGPELDTYGSDESGKTKKPTSIKERQSVVRFCSEIDGEFLHRKQWYTTTVEIEPDEEDNYEFQELTAMSNPLERDDNGRTMSGLYTYFLPAYKGMYFDKYGYPDEERAKVYLLNTRKKLEEEGKLRELSSFKRKNPMTFKEAFSADGTAALYNPELLNEQLDNISWRNDLTERGDLKWYKDSPFVLEEMDERTGEKTVKVNKVIWVPNVNGRFEKVAGWWPREDNLVVETNGVFLPNNKHAFRIGYDTFKYDKTKSKRRSNAGAFAYQIKDDLYPSQFDDMLVLKYAFRPESRRIANMDVLMMSWLCGCQMLVERNAGDHYVEHYREWKTYGFLMWLPGEQEPGITTDGAGKTTQMICNYTEQYINEHIKKVYFKSLIRKETGWLGFKVEDTERFDEPMGAGITFIAVKGKKYQLPNSQRNNIEDYIPYKQAI